VSILHEMQPVVPREQAPSPDVVDLTPSPPPPQRQSPIAAPTRRRRAPSPDPFDFPAARRPRQLFDTAVSIFVYVHWLNKVCLLFILFYRLPLCSTGEFTCTSGRRARTSTTTTATTTAAPLGNVRALRGRPECGCRTCSQHVYAGAKREGG